MAGLAKEIDLSQLPGWLNGLQQRLQSASFKPAWDAVRGILASATKLNFQKQSGPLGEAWPPLKMRSGKALHDKGILIGSVTSKNAPINQETDTSLTWGTNVDYASIHQTGGTITPKSAKALAIPMTAEARRARGPRSMDLNLVWPNGKRSGTLRDDAGKVQFLLVPSVTVPARPFIGWNDQMQEDCTNAIADTMDDIVNKT